VLAVEDGRPNGISKTWTEWGQVIDRIEVLEVRGPQVDLRDIPASKNLQRLRIHRGSLKNAGDEPEKRWPQLRVIELGRDCHVEKATRERLIRRLPGLAVRGLTGNDHHEAAVSAWVSSMKPSD
jgi:hypothetical protein